MYVQLYIYNVHLFSVRLKTENRWTCVCIHISQTENRCTCVCIHISQTENRWTCVCIHISQTENRCTCVCIHISQTENRCTCVCIHFFHIAVYVTIWNKGIWSHKPYDLCMHKSKPTYHSEAANKWCSISIVGSREEN
jgi:hypothetical protein